MTEKQPCREEGRQRKLKAVDRFEIMAYLVSGLLFFLMAASTMQHDGKFIIQTISYLMTL